MFAPVTPEKEFPGPGLFEGWRHSGFEGWRHPGLTTASCSENIGVFLLRDNLFLMKWAINFLLRRELDLDLTPFLGRLVCPLFPLPMDWRGSTWCFVATDFYLVKDIDLPLGDFVVGLLALNEMWPPPLEPRGGASWRLGTPGKTAIMAPLLSVETWT